MAAMAASGVTSTVARRPLPIKAQVTLENLLWLAEKLGVT